MQLIKNHPKKSTWQLTVLTDQCGNVLAAHTGWAGGDSLTRVANKLGLVVTQVDNFVFTGAFKPISYSRGRSSVTQTFEDKDCPQSPDDKWHRIQYDMAPQATSDLFKAIADGEVVLEDGYFVGTFTFAKQGDQISVRPYKE